MHADGIGLNELARHRLVLNTLGAGFQEKVCEDASAHELREAGRDVVQQSGLTVTYDGVVAGQYFIDLMVEQALLVVENRECLG